MTHEARVRRRSIVAVLSTLLLAALCVACPAPLAAQADKGNEKAAAPAPAKAAPPDAAAAPGAPAATPRVSVLWWLVETSGWIGAILLAMSIYFVAKVVTLFLQLRLDVAMPPEMVQQCEELLKARDFAGVYKAVKADDSFYSAVVATGLSELQFGLTEARESMERMGDSLVVEMEKDISMLAVFGTLGPMIGLLGTLKGMITSFSAIAMGGAQLNATAVAGGISEALVLTFEGVGIAVPSIYFFALFRNRIASISTAAMLAADDFIRRANAAVRAKQAAPAAAPPTP